MYFVISVSNGDVRVEAMDEEELLKRLQPDVDGDTWYGRDARFVNRIESSGGFKPGGFGRDPMHWGENTILIIDGTIMLPAPIQTIIVQYKLVEA